MHLHFDHIDLGSQHLVHEKILGLQMKDAADAELYLGEQDTLHQELLRMGVNYLDGEAIFNLLKGLPRTGTWPAFKLVLQTSVSAPAASASVLPASNIASTSTSVMPSASRSSISSLLATGTTTFETVSICIAAEAHCLAMEASLVPFLGSEYHTNVATAVLSLGSINPATGLRCMRNNPSGTFCDTPLDDGSICGAISHDRAHCFKPGSGMAGQQPTHWGTGKHNSFILSGDSAPSGAMVTSPSVPTSVTTSAPSSQPIVAAVATCLDNWPIWEYDLSC